MGVDAIIEFELPNPLTENELSIFNFRIGECFGLVAEYEKTSAMDDNPCRYDVSTVWRYYGEGYERGPIIEIIGMLRFIRDYFQGNVKLYYSGDTSEYPSLWTIETENEVWQHFVKYGHAPYLGYSDNHPCPDCGGPMCKGVYHAGKDYYRCQGCNFSEWKATP